MASWFRSFWQKVKKPLEIIAIIAVCLLVIALIVLVLLTYIFHLNVHGLTGKNLWDWLQQLIILAVLAIGGYLFNYTTSRNEQKSTQLRDQTERDVASDNQREAPLQLTLIV
jgi:cation transport ATPase